MFTLIFVEHHTVLIIRNATSVLTIFSIKSSSNLKSRDSFGICSSWGFRNYPRLLNLMKIWLTYWRLNTPDIISKFYFFSFRCKDENVWRSISLPNLHQIQQSGGVFSEFAHHEDFKTPQIVEFHEDLAEMLKVKHFHLYF